MNNTYYTLKEVSERLKTPIAFLRKEIKSKKLKAHFIGRQYILSDDEIKKYILLRGIKNVR